MSNQMRLGIAGLGAIGLPVARAVDAGDVPGMLLSAVSARDKAAAADRLTSFKSPPVVVEVEELAERADVIVEAAPANVFPKVARAVLERGRVFMPLSVGALLANMDLVELAEEKGGRIIVPSGATLGLDALKAMAVGEIESVTIKSTKPPRGLSGAPYLVENGISLDDLQEATLLFSGNALEAAAGFPANVNVAAAISLAGIGPERTQVEVWADLGIQRNQQTVTIVSDSGDATMTISNLPSPENPRTSRITALSVIAALKRLTSPLTVGT